MIGAELEENLGLRYMASFLESKGHEAEIIPFNSSQDTSPVVKQILSLSPEIAGLSMVFTIRGQEFCNLAEALREGGYKGHIIGGGPFASFNCVNLLKDFPAFDSIALGEGEKIISDLADHLRNLPQVAGICYRQRDGSIATNPSEGNPDDLDALPFPRRSTLPTYFDKPMASIVTSRGCWRNCAFCSINAWYDRVGGKKFRVRSVENVVQEMKDLYYHHGARIFNFQDDNFYLPGDERALSRFREMKGRLREEGIEKIAIAIKARPDSITYESAKVLDDLGLFRVFLGVENASENGLKNLNRRSTFDHTLQALKILNDFDVHIAYNLLLFEPNTTMEDVLINLRFMERYIDNPFNFCRAEVHAGTGLQDKLRTECALLGNYFSPDYRIKDPRVEALHQITNYAFFDRNFSDSGLHYFNMQVDFYFQLLRRFHPEILSQSLRGAAKTFIRRTNLDTYQRLCQIYDFIESANPLDQAAISGFAREMRYEVDEAGRELHTEGEIIQARLKHAYDHRDDSDKSRIWTGAVAAPLGILAGLDDVFGVPSMPIPYDVFKGFLAGRR